jgi:hypothetical protein
MARRVDPLDEITAWIGQHPERVGALAFMAAKAMARDGLPYRAVFDRCLRAAMDAGRPEATARLWIFRGFAAAAAGHPKPPFDLEDGDF